MKLAFAVIAIEAHGDAALVKAESSSGDYLAVRLDKSQMAALGFQQQPVEQTKLGDKLVDVPVENGGQWKWAAGKTDVGVLVMPAIAIVVDVTDATPQAAPQA